ncbi:2,4-dihydroxyhept-2-ene-1,7-dioic acid aldolase [Azospirillum thiophilum]|uniref:2,4-dihydroxyhept-2-ene-1,7-dioic acid aldolase n=1 Tax=Azospirillum thiophilum TaxID=528244 RepID=A0AAC9EY78_9PROT|nr:DUF2218 domain-containing protein [Azospirillum thiophilum]ALG73601.1 2,4-dihydroxyhept-2-ene-1,7-dioic acid aldolase [Azospirillum thiophilum]KJR62990.1 2,4-dihydroxyhept-2-ene-1,7-dioic acid aldolase [Azospirillum thiophilum]
MLTETATVPTALASRYLQQLCKHFAHKITVRYDTASGDAQFPWGACAMTAADGALTLRCEAEDAEALARVKAVVEDHLVRFAWKEGLKPDWTPVG